MRVVLVHPPVPTSYEMFVRGQCFLWFQNIREDRISRTYDSYVYYLNPPQAKIHLLYSVYKNQLIIDFETRMRWKFQNSIRISRKYRDILSISQKYPDISGKKHCSKHKYLVVTFLPLACQS